MSSSLRLGPLGQVSLFALDTARAERFYRDTLGLPHVFTFGDLAFFDAGGVRIYVHTKPAAEWRPGSVLYFQVDDIAQAHRDLASRGVDFVAAPRVLHRHETPGIEEWMAFFEDGEGNLLALMAQVPGPTGGPAGT